MSFRTRLISALVVIALLVGLIGISMYSTGSAGSTPESLFVGRETLYLWYADDSLSDYLNDTAVAYNEGQTHVRVEPVLITDTDYVGRINESSVDGTNYPDLYIAGNNELERLYKGGLAAVIEDEHFADGQTYPETALHAVTYGGQYVAYPFCFETSAFLYNKELLQSMIDAAVQEDDSDNAEGAAASENATTSEVSENTTTSEDSENATTSAASEDTATSEDAGTQEDPTAENTQAEETAADEQEGTQEEDDAAGVPQTMVDIINLSNQYDAPQDLTAIFKWDVSDIFYNYGFVGNYMDVGGTCGDDPTQLDIYNDKVIQCLQVYQQLNQYFSIDSQSDDYDTVLQDFIDGKIIFTIATSDAVKKISDAITNGESSLDYGVVRIPDLTGELLSRTMSVTDCVVVNAYGEQQDEANAFAQYMLYHHNTDFYARTGKGLAQNTYTYGDHHMNGFYEAYVDSVPITKLREAANFWLLLENTFAQVWDGADANTALHDLTQQLMIQISGTENYKVEKLPDPPQISIRSQLEGEE